MATSSLRREQARRQHFSLAPAILIGAAAAALPLLAPAPAKAQKCNATTITTSVITVNAAGADYEICTYTTRADDQILQQNKWYGDQQMARDFAAAVLAAQGNPAVNNPFWPPTINTLKNKDDGPYFLWGLVGNNQGKAVSYDFNGNNFNINNGPNPSAADLHDYVILASLDPPDGAPGPLPLLGAGAAFGWSRRLRRRLKDKPDGHEPCALAAVELQRGALALPAARPVFCSAGRR